MKYISTRGSFIAKYFSETIIGGVADDGGLYMPEVIPVIEKTTLNNWQKLTYIELATEIISFFASDMDKNDIYKCCHEAYLAFDTELKKLNNNLYLLELFHGPTLSFKDYALQFLGKAIDLVLSKKQLHKQIITATSGDTGPAAIYGFKDCKFVNIKVYYPKTGVSKFQEEQMLSIKQKNIEVRGLDATFDECQKLVKETFTSDTTGNLMTVNSINIGRIVAQIVYYFWTYLQMDQKQINFFIPTGNFGNIFAGFLAKQMGVNIRLSICVNENDTLYRFYQTGKYQPKQVIKTKSNAIDIANPSNFERVLYLLDKDNVKNYITSLKNQGYYQASDELLQKFRSEFTVYKITDNQAQKIQNSVWQKYNLKICPHTAVAMYPALKKKGIAIVLSTADWKKFIYL